MQEPLTDIRDGSAVMLPLAWQAPDRVVETRIALEVAIDALMTLSTPFSVSFEMSAGGGGDPSAGWLISAIDGASTQRCAVDAIDVLNAAIAWQGVSEPCSWEPASAGPNWFALVPDDSGVPGRRINNIRSIPWELAKSRPERVTMRVDLIAPSSEGTTRRSVECRITVNGDGQSAADIAALIAADPPGEPRLTAVPVTDRDAAPTIHLPLTMVSHLIGSPSRVPDAWPAANPSSLTELLERIDETVPPHAVVFGGSGQGKTTLLEHMMLDSARRGTPRAVLCAHGDLAQRAVPIAERLDAEMTVWDFGHDRRPATWNITNPPSGVDASEWALTLVSVIKESFPVRNNDWFGPVGEKSLRVGCELLVRDVRNGSREPITRLADVLAAGDHDEWIEALHRVGDQRLQREMIEVWSMVDKDREGHAGLWLTAKVERFVSDPAVVRVLGQRNSTVDPGVVTSGATIIASAPAAKLGDQGSKVILGTLLAQLWHHLRADAQRHQTIDVFVDEIQRFAPEHLIPMLAESRKHGVRLRLATQTPNNLDPALRDAILSNCGAVSAFRVGTRDAQAIEPLFPHSPVAALTLTPRHWVTTSFGDSEMLTQSEPPLDW